MSVSAVYLLCWSAVMLAVSVVNVAGMTDRSASGKSAAVVAVALQVFALLAAIEVWRSMP